MRCGRPSPSAVSGIGHCRNRPTHGEAQPRGLRRPRRPALETTLASLDLGGGDVRRGQLVFTKSGSSPAPVATRSIPRCKIGSRDLDADRAGPDRSATSWKWSCFRSRASFVRSYEPMLIAIVDGPRSPGLAKSETPDEIVLNGEARPGGLCLPARRSKRSGRGWSRSCRRGLDQQLSQQELADLSGSSSKRVHAEAWGLTCVLAPGTALFAQTQRATGSRGQGATPRRRRGALSMRNAVVGLKRGVLLVGTGDEDSPLALQSPRGGEGAYDTPSALGHALLSTVSDERPPAGKGRCPSDLPTRVPWTRWVATAFKHLRSPPLLEPIGAHR